jgi:hypothetical protein
MKITPNDSPDFLPLLAGTVSEGPAREFVGFCKIHQDLPKKTQILANPTGTPVPQDAGIIYALLGAMSHWIDETNIETFMKFLVRWPKEFQIVCLKETIRRKKHMMGNPLIQEWISNTAVEIF